VPCRIIVFSGRNSEKALRENPPNGDFFVTFRPATRKYATFHAVRFRLLFVVSLPGEAKGPHAKTRHRDSLCFYNILNDLVCLCINMKFSLFNLYIFMFSKSRFRLF